MLCVWGGQEDASGTSPHVLLAVRGRRTPRGKLFDPTSFTAAPRAAAGWPDSQWDGSQWTGSQWDGAHADGSESYGSQWDGSQWYGSQWY